MFFKLFGRGLMNKENETVEWRWLDFRCYNVRAGERHWLLNGSMPLLFVNIQKHGEIVQSAGEDFKETYG